MKTDKEKLTAAAVAAREAGVVQLDLGILTAEELAGFAFAVGARIDRIIYGDGKVIDTAYGRVAGVEVRAQSDARKPTEEEIEVLERNGRDCTLGYTRTAHVAA